MSLRFTKRTARENYARTVVLRHALAMAVPCACVALGIKHLSNIDVAKQNSFMRNQALFKVLNDAAAYSGFSLVLGFLVVFRTQLAYNRFWEGVTAGHRMCSEWCDSSSSILAFTKISKVDRNLVMEFERKYIKFLSLLHGIAVACLRDLDGLQLAEIDLEELSPESIKDLRESPYPTTTVFQWVQDVIIQAMEDQIISVPPPILSRVFNELANGMVAYHDCMKIQVTNVPLPYKHMTRILMGIHWFVTPLVMCMWTEGETWAFIFTLVQSLIFWCLYYTAHQIEFPFQAGEISYSVTEMHREFNKHLVAMARCRTGQVTVPHVDLGPESWVHTMKSWAQKPGRETHIAQRNSAVQVIASIASIARGREVERNMCQLASDRSVEIQIEASCGPQIDSGETCINNLAAIEEVASGSIAECKATVPPAKLPNKEGPSTSTSNYSLCRTERSIQSEHLATSTQGAPSEMYSLANCVPATCSGSSEIQCAGHENYTSF